MRISTKILALGIAAIAFAAPFEAVAAEMAAPESVRQEIPLIKPRTGGIDVEIPGEAPARVEIFALTGQALKQFDAQPGSTSVDLPSGIYIVRIGHVTKTVKVQ